VRSDLAWLAFAAILGMARPPAAHASDLILAGWCGGAPVAIPIQRRKPADHHPDCIGACHAADQRRRRQG